MDCWFNLNETRQHWRFYSKTFRTQGWLKIGRSLHNRIFVLFSLHNMFLYVCGCWFLKWIICIGLSMIPPELPDTSFTRSISNPEAVMRRRRQQKLEKKLQQYRSKVSCFVFCLRRFCRYRRFCSCCFYTVPKYWFVQDGAPDTGGTLKIYGEALRKEVGL